MVKMVASQTGNTGGGIVLRDLLPKDRPRWTEYMDTGSDGSDTEGVCQMSDVRKWSTESAVRGFSTARLEHTNTSMSICGVDDQGGDKNASAVVPLAATTSNASMRDPALTTPFPDAWAGRAAPSGAVRYGAPRPSFRLTPSGVVKRHTKQTLSRSRSKWGRGNGGASSSANMPQANSSTERNTRRSEPRLGSGDGEVDHEEKVPEEVRQRRRDKRYEALVDIKLKPEYQEYYATRNAKRLKHAPSTPNPEDRTVSKRQWESDVMKWRLDLRRWVAAGGPAAA